MSRPVAPRPAGGRGFTLVELIMTLGISAFALATILGTFLAQHRSMAGQESVRRVQQSARAAAEVLERAVRRAGFGVDPWLAFDFVNYPAQPCEGATVCPRDLVDGPDRLVFYARNPRYAMGEEGPTGAAWWYSAATEDSLTLVARAGDVFRQGRVLQILCDGATESTYVSVADNVTAEADGDVVLPLEPISPAPFHRQDVLLDTPCFSGGAGGPTLAVEIDRFHFFVRALPSEDGESVPWLLLDTGLDENGDGEVDENDWHPVGEGIEDLQVAYVMNASDAVVAADGNRDWVFGNTPAVQETPLAAAAAPRYQDAPQAAVRFNAHPANIRAVRFTLTARGVTDEAQGATIEVARAAENRTTASLPETPHKRFSLGQLVSTPNLQSRSRFRF